jgi:hypothetical protein
MKAITAWKCLLRLPPSMGRTENIREPLTTARKTRFAYVGPLCQLPSAPDILLECLQPGCARALNRYAIVGRCGSS